MSIKVCLNWKYRSNMRNLSYWTTYQKKYLFYWTNARRFSSDPKSLSLKQHVSSPTNTCDYALKFRVGTNTTFLWLGKIYQTEELGVFSCSGSTLNFNRGIVLMFYILVNSSKFSISISQPKGGKYTCLYVFLLSLKKVNKQLNLKT